MKHNIGSHTAYNLTTMYLLRQKIDESIFFSMVAFGSLIFYVAMHLIFSEPMFLVGLIVAISVWGTSAILWINIQIYKALNPVKKRPKAVMA